MFAEARILGNTPDSYEDNPMNNRNNIIMNQSISLAI